MSNIQVHLTPVQEQAMNQMDAGDRHLQNALAAAQNFIDQNEWKPGFSVFAMNAYYNHETQKTRVLFLMLNNTSKLICSFSAQMHPIDKSGQGADFSVANVVLGEDYLGQVEPKHAILFFVDIPTRGLDQDASFEFNDLGLQMYSINI